MNIKELKELIKDLPDDMPVCGWDSREGYLFEFGGIEEKWLSRFKNKEIGSSYLSDRKDFQSDVLVDEKVRVILIQ